MFKLFISVALLVISFAISAFGQANLLPKTGSGLCVENQKFTINSVVDLKANINDLECIFNAGLAPDAIGLGFYYGTVLLHENSMGMAALAAPFYQGDYVVRTTCNQETVHLGTLKVAGLNIGTAPWTLAPFIGVTDVLEAPIDATKNNILMDFRANVQEICPVEDQAALLNAKGFLPYRYPPVPVNCYVDIARVVGRDVEDGGLILLVKGLNEDPESGWKTTLFYALKTFDPVVKPDFKAGTEIVNDKLFSYTHRGFVETVTVFGASGLPLLLSNVEEEMLLSLISNPLTAFSVMKGGVPALLSSAATMQPSSLLPLSLLGASSGFLPLGLLGSGLLGSGASFLEGTTAGKLLEEVQRRSGTTNKILSLESTSGKRKAPESSAVPRASVVAGSVTRVDPMMNMRR